MEFKEEETRIALVVDGVEAGEITWKNDGDSLWIVEHTRVNEAFQGKGYAGQLVEAVVERARREGKKLELVCPYAKKVIDRTPEYQDVLHK
jgi:predicted GNAT family acetyltransferase